MTRILLGTFFKRELFFLCVMMVFFAVAGASTSYMLLNITSEYYKWKPVRELGNDWYGTTIYASGELYEYVAKEYGITDLYELWEKDWRYMDTEDRIPDDDVVYYLFQCPEEEVKQLQGRFPGAESIQPAAEVAAEKQTWKEESIRSIPIVILLWGFMIGSSVYWFRRTLRKSREERNYLFAIGYSPQILRKKYSTCIFLFVPFFWILACCMIFVPGPGAAIISETDDGLLAGLKYFENLEIYYTYFWQMYPIVPILMLLICGGAAGIVCVWFLRIWKKETAADGRFGEMDGKELCIRDLPLRSNLELIFIAQGFSRRAAGIHVKQMLQAKGIHSGVNRPMTQLDKTDWETFRELRDELMGDF